MAGFEPATSSFRTRQVQSAARSLISCLQAPPQAAIGAAGRRRLAEQIASKRAVFLSIPNIAQRILGRITEREGVVAAHRERGDAARQRLAVCGEIHERPRPRAQRPWPLSRGALEAGARLGCTRSIEANG